MAGKIQQIIEVITKGAGKSEKEIKGVSGSLKGLAKQAGVAAAAYFGTRALINGIQGSIDAFAQQELAQKKLQAALGKTSPLLLAQARALQQVSMFGDEVILEAQSMIASFVKEESAIAAATKATLDLAAAKGMDLVVAADLVSKTLGSSTNALSRYGIEVVGAVGSTERLESLTGNLATVFGGQASQQAQTLTGQLEQMKNAMGDTAEDLGALLAPAIGNVAGILKTAAENVSDFIAGFTDTPLDSIIKKLEDLGSAGEGLLLLKNLQIDRDLKVVNLELKEMAKGYTSIEQLTEKSNALTSEAGNLAIELADIQKNLSKEDEERLKDELRRSKQTILARGTSLDFLAKKIENETELEEKLGIAQTNRINQIEKELEFLPDIGAKILERNELEAQRVEIAKNLNKEKDIESGKEINLQKIKQKGNEFLDKERDKALTKNFEADGAKAINNAWDMAGHAYSYGAERGGPFLGALYGGVALSAGFAYAKNIKAAQYGADFVTDGPQMMMVGEGNGPERVQVTPLVDPNLDGPQGGGMTINIQGSVIGTEQFTEDVLMPQIEEGLRLGNRI